MKTLILLFFITLTATSFSQVRMDSAKFLIAGQRLYMQYNYSMPVLDGILLKQANGITDNQAYVESLGSSIVEKINNHIGSAKESNKGKLYTYWSTVANPTKAGFETWKDTVGTFERENPIIE